MNRSEFTHLLDMLFDKIKRINDTKGVEYAGQDDALANFKRIARGLQERGFRITPEIVCLVYLQKHLDAIYSYVGSDRERSEPIEDRVCDAMLYLALLYGLISERRRGQEW